MKRYSVFFIGLCLCIGSCASDDGFNTDIQKVSTVFFTLNPAEASRSQDRLDVSLNTNLARVDFVTYLGKIENFEVNRIAFVVRASGEDLNPQQMPIGNLNLDMRGLTGTAVHRVFSLEEVRFGQANAIEVFNRDSINTQAVNLGIDFIRSAMLSVENIIWDLSGDLPTNLIDANYEFELQIDLTASVVID